jgi:hypothetical protein
MKKKNVIAAEKSGKGRQPIAKGLQADVMARLQVKGLTTKLAQQIIQSKDNFLAEAMVKALKEALVEEKSRKAS